MKITHSGVARPNHVGRVTEAVIGAVVRTVAAVQKLRPPQVPDGVGVADGGGATNITSGGLQSYLLGPGFGVVSVVLKLPVTRFDTPAVKAERLRQAEVLHQQLDKTGHLSSLAINTPERQRMRDQIVDALYAGGAARKDHEAWVIISPPAGGKSTISDPLAKKTGALVIDPEGPLDYLPEYQETHSGLYTDAERRQIDDRVVRRAIDHHDNIILHTTSGLSAEHTVRELKRYQYKVHLISLELPLAKVVARAQNRWRETGRFSDPLVDKMSQSGCREAFVALKGSVDTYARYTNDVPRGHAPILLEEGPGINTPANS